MILLLFIYCLQAFGSETFVNECLFLPDDVSIKEIFNTKDCHEISKKLEQVTSFSEIILPANRRKKEKNRLAFPWTDDFPSFYGLNKKTMHDIYSYKPTFDSTGDIFIKDLQIFKDYKNITHINYLPDYPYYQGSLGICKIIKNFPNLKTIIINSALLINPLVDNCLSKSAIDGVIINNQFAGFSFFAPKTKIIGIEYYKGSLEKLMLFRHLKFVGIANNASTLDGLESLYGLTELTHVSLNLHENITDLNKLRLFKNLTYLNVTCVQKEKENSPYTSKCPNRSNLSDISFISKLTWLEHLNLSYHNISDISPLSQLKELNFLKLRGNSIKSLVNLNTLPKLKYFDISGNNLISTEGIRNLPNLYFLNLSGNELINFTDLNKLNELKYLNLSHNPKKIISIESPLKSLKVLNLNGGGGSPSMDRDGKGIFHDLFKTFKYEERLLIETLFHDYTLTPTESNLAKCVTRPRILDSQEFHSFPNLEVLSLKNNQLEKLPHLVDLKKLRYLNLERNDLTYLENHRIPQLVESIQLQYNSLSSLPDFSDFINLKQLNLNLNDILEINYIKSLPKGVFELDLGGNLIKDVSLLKNNFGYDSYYLFYDSINISQNPVGKDTINCPIGNSYFINKICQDYLDGKVGVLIPPTKVEGKPMIQGRDEDKCSITYLDFEPHKRSFSPTDNGWFEN